MVAQLSKRSGERHWHVATPLAMGTVAVVVMSLVGESSKWVAFAMLSVAAMGIWGPHGPLLTWPAAMLEGTAAASGTSFSPDSYQPVLAVLKSVCNLHRMRTAFCILRLRCSSLLLCM